MPDLDDTDLAILDCLLTDGRRPFSDIGEEVGLSGPAVSARVERLQEAGVVRGFTVDVDRSALETGVELLVELDPVDGETARETARNEEAIEHTFLAADGQLYFLLRVEPGEVNDWLERRFAGEFSVTLLDRTAWDPSLGAAGFSLSCAECGNAVGPDGETETLDGERYRFCCPSCLELFVDRYERFEEAA